jgi:hypothetical protein
VTTTPAMDSVVVSPLAPAIAAFDSSHWASAVRLARQALAKKDLSNKDRRAAREIVARALIRDRKMSEGTQAFVDLLRAYPTYKPAANFIADERGAFETARLNLTSSGVTPPVTTPPGTTPPAGSATIAVKVTPFASTFSVDGAVQDQNKGSFTASVKPGRHVVLIEHPTLGKKEWTVDIGTGERKDLSHDFAVGAATVSVTSEPTWGDIYVDGVRIGHTTPWEVRNLSAGTHEISLVREGWTVDGGAKSVDVKAGESKTVKFKLKAKK